MQFHSIIGQQAIKQHLIQSVANGRVSHTQLFLGAEGVGALPLALAFAQYLNCENRQPGDSCGKCPSCIKAEKLIHPDIHYSYPTVTSKGSKPKSTDFIEEWRNAIKANPYLNVNEWLDFMGAENKQGNITVEECHDIIHKLSLKTYEATYKILILWMPEYLREAGNVLLKSLEEPPDNTIFLLVAESQEQILSTILSRTQLVKIPPLHEEDIRKELVSRFSMEEKQARHISRTVEGNLNEAIRLVDNTEDDNEQLLLQLFRFAHGNNLPEMNNLIDDLVKLGRENQKTFFRYCLGFLREVFIADTLGGDQARLSEAELKLAKYLNEKLDFERKEKIVGLFNDSPYQIERNANPRILFLNLFITLSKLLRNNTVSLQKG